MKLKGVSIRSRLIRLISVVSAISLSIVFTALFIYEIVSYREDTIEEVNVLANILAANSTAALAFDDAEAAREILSAVKAEKLVIGAVLFRSDGSVLTSFNADSTTTEVRSVPPADGFQIAGGRVEGVVPVVLGDKRLGTLYILRSTADIERRLFLYAMIAGAVIVVSFVLTYLLSTRLWWTIANPLISLSSVASQVSEQHDYSVRATGPADGEIGQLKDTFNTMLSKIEIQNNEIQRHTQELEAKIDERTREYRREKELAEAVVNSSLVLIAVFDMEMRLIAYNDKCEEEFGLKREQVLGRRFDDAIPQVKGSLTYDSILRAFKGEFIHNPQYRSTVTGDFYESFMRPLRNENGEIYAVLMTAHNIQGFIQANAELQKSNAELEQFAYVASHDLQEPLRKVLLFTDRLNEELRDKSETVGRYLEKINSATRRMSNLIRDVLSYSRLTRMEQSFVPTDLNEVIAQVHIDLELSLQEKQGVIISDHLPVITGSPLQLSQLFSNLISNALKFSERQPVVQVRAVAATSQEISAEGLTEPGDFVKIQVIDNGIGFDPQHAGKIFTLFQRLHQDTKYQGTGIGLALCKRIVINHRGSIRVESTPKVGTTFTIFLPITIAR